MMQPQQHIKKVIAFSFLVVMIMPMLIILMLLLQQRHVIHKMKEKLESESLHTITLNKKDINWVKQDKEILVGNELFDVKTIKEENDRVHFTGLFDHEETTIEKSLGDLSGKSGENQLTPLSQLLSLLQHVFYNSLNITVQTMETVSLKIESDFISSLMQLPQVVLTPPPRQ